MKFFTIAGGKRNEQLILPLNSSLSITLDKKEVILHISLAIVVNNSRQKHRVP